MKVSIVLPFFALALCSLTLLDDQPGQVYHQIQVCKRSDIGFEVKVKLGVDFHDRNEGLFEIMHTDSSISFAKVLYPMEQQFAKGQIFSGHLFVADDTLAMRDKIATPGSFKKFYPTDSSFVGKSSIAFMGYLPNTNTEAFMLPDLTIESGVLAPGDTVSMMDAQGRKAICLIHAMDVSDDFGGQIQLPFATSSFNRGDSKIAVYYTTLQGESLGEKINIIK